MKRLARIRKILIGIIVIILVLVLRTVAVRIQLLPRSQTEIVRSFNTNRKDFEQYVETTKSLVDEAKISNFSAYYDVFEYAMRYIPYDKEDIIKASMEIDAETMRKIMPFEAVWTSNENGVQVMFRLKHERGIVYTDNGKKPYGAYIVYTVRLADHWYYYEEDMKRILKAESLG